VEPERDRVIELRNPDLLWRKIDGDLVALDGRTWEYMTVNDAGRLVWEALAEGATRSRLIELLVETYGITSATANHDLEEFLDMMRQQDLISE